MTERTEIFDKALSNTQRHHATSKTFSGRFLFRYAERIKGIIDELGCDSMLDYGCGKGVQYEREMPSTGQMLEDYFALGQPIWKFDPGLPKFAQKPEAGTKFDMVIATQVLCWIPSADIPGIVDELLGYANKAVFIGERIKRPKKQMMRDIDEHMPFDWTLDDWVKALERPDAPEGVSLFLGTDDGMYKVL